MNEKEVEIIEGREVWPIYKSVFMRDNKTIKSYCARFNNLDYEKAAREATKCERFGNMKFDSTAPCRDYGESIVNRDHMCSGDADYKEKELEAIEKAKKDAISKAYDKEVEIHERQLKLTAQMGECLRCEIFDRCMSISRTRAMSE